jgi:hypothetical protein
MFTALPTKRCSLALLAVAAGALPAAAQARPIFDPPTVAQVSQQAPPSNVVQKPQASASTGFQWDDAGIGAAGAIVLLSGGAGAATAIRRRRHRVATA